MVQPEENQLVLPGRDLDISDWLDTLPRFKKDSIIQNFNFLG